MPFVSMRRPRPRPAEVMGFSGACRASGLSRGLSIPGLLRCPPQGLRSLAGAAYSRISARPFCCGLFRQEDGRETTSTAPMTAMSLALTMAYAPVSSETKVRVCFGGQEHSVYIYDGESTPEGPTMTPGPPPRFFAGVQALLAVSGWQQPPSRFTDGAASAPCFPFQSFRTCPLSRQTVHEE
jgi:hypothetical protein